MATGLSGDQVRGHLDLLLLSVLQGAPAHGYEIARRLRARSEGVLDLGEGTLYPALHRLERDGLVASAWQSGEGGPRRRVYRLTRGGRRALGAQRRQWEMLARTVEAVLGTPGSQP